MESLTESGYYIFGNNDEFMIIDGGKIGPDYQPSHGYCDLFSYEYSLNGNKIIVDSGVYDYEEGKMRDYCRSTRAHNTLMIDGKEQCEIRKSFRVGRRAEPREVSLNEEGDNTFSQGLYHIR